MDIHASLLKKITYYTTPLSISKALFYKKKKDLWSAGPFGCQRNKDGVA
ncbi:hypothetical protein fHyEco03_gp58 [Escherichia phage vB_EcoM_fHy-Eco03]|nr:hypothetical protein fHyEco03_gp58 [Escherichia phage vB_EcoM_fHy-Eco03]